MGRILSLFIGILLVVCFLLDVRSENLKIDVGSDRLIHKIDTTDSVYIPKDFVDAFHTLDQILSKEQRYAIQSMPNNQFLNGAHLSFGMWIRNNWGLWSGSRFKDYMLRVLNIHEGLAHPDILSDYILDGYYKYLTDKDFNINKYIESIRIK